MAHRIALLCFFVSGFAGLAYEVCWIRKASLVFGSTNAALSTVLATFFGGLALGNELFGRLAPRIRRPLRVYAALELGLAVLALLSPLGFAAVDSLYGAAYRSLGASPVLAGTRVALVALLLLPPTILMGGTFPLFCRQFVSSPGGIARSVGQLYAVNTLGAAAGAAATGLLLLPAIGVTGCIVLGAVCNAIAGLAVLPLQTTAAAPDPEPQAAGAAPPAPRGDRIVAALFFCVGFVAVGTQVLWARYLSLVVRNTVHTYAITLTVVLLGIVLGSAAASRLFDTRLPRAASLGTLQVAGALGVLGLMLLPAPFWSGVGNDVLVYVLLMLVPAALSGAVFPLAIRMVVDDPVHAGARAGRMAAINTLGGIGGALLFGFVGLPLLGLADSLRAVTAVGVAGGLVAWWGLARPTHARARAVASVAAVALWVVLPTVLDTRLPVDFLGAPGRLVAWREGETANLSVVRRDGVRELHIDRWWQGSDHTTHQIMAAHVPMLAHPDPRRVLVVGVGAGQAPARFLLHGVDRLDCVDIEPALFTFVGEHFGSEWMNAPASRLLPADGRTVLAHGDEQHDIVSVEVGQLFRPGVASFYTGEFYARAAERLAPGGLLAQFVPLAFLDPESLRRVVATFVDTFPRCFLWYNHSELLLVGVNAETVELRSERIALVERPGPLRDDLRYAHWGGPTRWQQHAEVFLAGFLCGPDGLAALAGDAAPYTDDVPALEFEAAGIPETATNELPLVALIERHLEPVNSVLDRPLDTAVAARVAETRTRNLRDIEARAHRRLARLLRGQGDVDGARDRLLLARALNPESADAARELADLKAAGDDLSGAEQLYREALAIDPDHALAHRGLGFTLIRLGRAEDALPPLRRAVALRPEDAEAHNYMGAALANTGNARAALPHLERSLALWPGYPSAAQHLALVREALAAVNGRR